MSTWIFIISPWPLPFQFDFVLIFPRPYGTSLSHLFENSQFFFQIVILKNNCIDSQRISNNVIWLHSDHPHLYTYLTLLLDFLSFIIIFFFFRSIKSNLCSQMFLGVGLSLVAGQPTMHYTLRENVFSFSQELSITSRSSAGAGKFLPTSPIHAAILSDLGLHRSYACCHSAVASYV